MAINFTKLSVLAVGILLVAASPGYAQIEEREFTTAKGRTIKLLPIDGMKCAEIDKMLARIDATRYRENAPVPHDDADAPLHEYERLLAEESFNRCVRTREKVTGGIIIWRRSPD